MKMPNCSWDPPSQHISQSECVWIWFGHMSLPCKCEKKEYGTRKVSRKMMKHDETSTKITKVWISTKSSRCQCQCHYKWHLWRCFVATELCRKGQGRRHLAQLVLRRLLSVCEASWSIYIPLRSSTVSHHICLSWSQTNREIGLVLLSPIMPKSTDVCTKLTTRPFSNRPSSYIQLGVLCTSHHEPGPAISFLHQETAKPLCWAPIL
jgi:hypothetical protein